jgi:hypothetical protein
VISGTVAEYVGAIPETAGWTLQEHAVSMVIAPKRRNMTAGTTMEYGWVRTPCANQIRVVAVRDGRPIAMAIVCHLAKWVVDGVHTVKWWILVTVHLRSISTALNLHVVFQIALVFVPERAAQVAIA